MSLSFGKIQICKRFPALSGKELNSEWVIPEPADILRARVRARAGEAFTTFALFSHQHTQTHTFLYARIWGKGEFSALKLRQNVNLNFFMV
jgi:hypothetical protein